MRVPSDFPKSLPEFEARFGTEEACRAFLEKQRWPDGFVCRCGSRRGFRRNTREVFECPDCNRQTSLTSGTIFAGTRKPLREWFRAMYFVAVQKTGMSAKALQRLMGFGSYETAWTWLHKIRKAMVRPERPKLEGKVEIDETFVGGVVEGAKGRGSPNPLVAIAVERVDVPGARRAALGRVRMQVIEDATQVSTTTFTCSNVEGGATVLTDGLSSYDELSEVGYRRKRKVIGNPKNASKFLPGVHRVASLVKRWLLGTHQAFVSPKHLQSYLDEFVFRFNRRKSAHPGKLFFRLLEIAITTKPRPYAAITTCAAQA